MYTQKWQLFLVQKLLPLHSTLIFAKKYAGDSRYHFCS